MKIVVFRRNHFVKETITILCIIVIQFQFNLHELARRLQYITSSLITKCTKKLQVYEIQATMIHHLNFQKLQVHYRVINSDY
jgi:hypothetical protein